jgi:hypothetical protein
MPDSNLVPRLIERLIGLTGEGKIDWKETASEDDFQAIVGQYVVTISRSRNSENWDAWDFQIRVADRKGTLIDEATDGDFDRTLKIGEHSPHKAFMHLYDAARRGAKKVDQALNDLLASLDWLQK